MSEASDARVEAELDDEEEAAAVTAHRSSPDRVVFTEEDNSDGWIATDLTVELRR
ncbi:hypothetical protein [Halomicrobium salinisoli]|uniref:hypothetical protein n=1 Tax=Halomicrobium salinisoli TaxID=2878391 RepID=UPI001CF055E6|nr:hypothetical protein [Halomicrobium salinisoli]